LIYLAVMMLGAFAYRIPAEGWRPAGWEPSALAGPAAMSRRFVPVGDAVKTPQFWLLWLVLCVNVSAGIGVLGMASPLLQEMFGGRLIGAAAEFEQLDSEQLKRAATVAAGFTGLLSLFNIAGRFFWASLSDYLGRKTTYAVFFLLGFLAYASIPSWGQSGRLAPFVAVFCLILTMYGGGFAAIPAYLADLFGAQMVGAIHGRLLTAWSVAGVLGPVLVNYWNDYQVRHWGTPRARAYDQTMYLLAGLLLVGFVANLAVRPVDDRWFWEPKHTAAGPDSADRSHAQAAAAPSPFRTNVRLAGFWLLVLAPVGWGVWVTLQQAGLLLSGTR
jgi:MFS family permease